MAALFSRALVSNWTKLVATSNRYLPIQTCSAHWNGLSVNQQLSLYRHLEKPSKPMNPNSHLEEGLEMFAEMNAASTTVDTRRSKLAMMSLRFAAILIGLAAA